MMIHTIPPWITLLFLSTVMAAIILYGWANIRSKKVLVFLIPWAVIHCLLAYQGFYLDTTSVPPHFGLILIPITLLTLFMLRKKEIDALKTTRNSVRSTFLHSIRVPMELFLAVFFSQGLIPEAMTYHGYNMDIIAGVTAPIVGILYWKELISKTILIWWNLIGSVLILTIFCIAILSTNTPIQQFGFDQPNIGLLHFPFILLPAVVVPLVIYTHLSDILLLLKTNQAT